MTSDWGFAELATWHRALSAAEIGDASDYFGSLLVAGCTDSGALNFAASATEDNGSCVYPVDGCTDNTACNYDSSATNDDGSCTFAAQYRDCDGCLNDDDWDYVCNEEEVAGCTDSDGCNYDSAATDDNDSCTYPPDSLRDCDGNCLSDADNNGVCEAAGCTDASVSGPRNYRNACNYDPDAEVDDGSCTYPAADWIDCFGDCRFGLETTGPLELHRTHRGLPRLSLLC